MRSFEIVEDKIEEAHFFLSKFETLCIGNIFEARYYFSAFLSAARSITFSLQASLSDLPGFCDWYSVFQEQLKSDPLCCFFHLARNESQKVGKNYIVGGKFDSTRKLVFYFDETIVNVPLEDVSTASNKYLCTLLLGIVECYQLFGEQIDPIRYYSESAIHKRNQSIEDIEEEIIGIRGYTKIEGYTDSDRLKLLLKSISMPSIDYVFNERLGKDRYGNKK